MGDTEELQREVAALLGAGIVRNVVVSLVVLTAILVVRWLFLRLLQTQIEQASTWYRTRKTTNWITAAVIVLALGTVWAGALGTLVTVFALAAAGLVISLGEVIRNLAGGVYVALRHPVRVGDRIEIGDVAGDVVDTGPLAFHVLEIGNWVDADQSTGRIIHVPNNLLFTTPAANYGAGFEYVWHEVEVPLTFESNWRRARDLLQQIAEDCAPAVDADRTAAQMRQASRRYLITYTHLTPAVYVTADPQGVRLTARVLCEIRKRRGLDHEIWSAVLDAFVEEPDIEFAYPPVRAYLRGPDAPA